MKKLFKYVISKKRSKENIGLIVDEDGQLSSRDEQKTEVFNVFFVSVFTSSGLIVSPPGLSIRSSSIQYCYQ